MATQPLPPLNLEQWLAMTPQERADRAEYLDRQWVTVRVPDTDDEGGE